MIFVKNIEIVHIKEDTIRVRDYGELPECTLIASVDDIKASETEVSFKENLIRGRSFRLPNGRDLIIGWNKEVEDAIGFPMNCFHNMNIKINNLKLELSNMEMERNRLNTECTDLLKKVNSHNRMTFFQRLKFLITRSWL